MSEPDPVTASSHGLRVLVCGGRRYGLDPAERREVYYVLQGLHERHRIAAIIEGGAPGADASAAAFAQQEGVPLLTFRPDWDTYGKAAGPRRNQRMLDEGKPDVVLAFPGGKGTADMARRAMAAGVEVRHYTGRWAQEIARRSNATQEPNHE